MAHYNRTVSGVGGWLAIFTFILLVASPLNLVLGVASSLYGDPSVRAAYPGPVFATIEIMEWSLALGGVAACWFLVYRLLKVQVWRSVQIVIAGIWIIGVGLTFAELALVSLIASIDPRQILAATAAEQIRPFVFGGIWTAYFLKSERVANTYLRDGVGGAADVFS